MAKKRMLFTIFRGSRVTKARLLSAMRRYDEELRPREKESGTRYAVEYDKKRYPPKRILELATGISRKTFSGGAKTNRVFSYFRCFPIRTVVSTRTRFKTQAELEHEERLLNARCPSLSTLENRLFRQRWATFPGDIAKLQYAGFPGVYVIARTKQSLTGKRVRERDIYYVGMSNYAGLKKRLYQFKSGVNRGKGHSTGNRLHKKKRLPPYVASVAVPCRTRKGEREPDDLRKTGIIAALEMCVLARIKARRHDHKEPELNKK